MLSSVVLPHPDGPTIATNSPSATVRSIPAITGSTPFAVGKLFRTSARAILVGITPPHGLESLQTAHRAIQQQPGQSNDDHARNDEVVTVARVARIDDQITQPRAQSD